MLEMKIMRKSFQMHATESYEPREDTPLRRRWCSERRDRPLPKVFGHLRSGRHSLVELFELWMLTESLWMILNDCLQHCIEVQIRQAHLQR